MTSQNEKSLQMLQRIFELEEFSENEELFTTSSTDPVSINFLCHRQIEECDGGSLYLC